MLPDKDFPSAEEVFPLSGDDSRWLRRWFNMTNSRGGFMMICGGSLGIVVLDVVSWRVMWICSGRFMDGHEEN